MQKLVADLSNANEGAAALLMEVKGPTPQELQDRIKQVGSSPTSAPAQACG